MTFAAQAAIIQPDLVALRRELHREPEIGLYLPRTQQRLLAALDGLPLEISTGHALSSITAVLRGGAVDRTGGQAVPAVLLRADMDALPVHEANGLDFRSAIAGVMHACGHDLHMAIGVGAARLLCAVREELPGDVVFMFQPAEEGPGGAGPMIDEGILDAAGPRAIAAFGLHVVSGQLAAGEFSTRRGTLMASADTLEVTVRGRGGHGSRPFLARDPIPAACEMVLALQAHVTRGYDIFDPVVVTVGSFHAGTKDNIIPPSATFSATTRAFSVEAREKLLTGLPEVVGGVAAAHGLGLDVVWHPGYPPTITDVAEVEFAGEVITDLFGADRLRWMAHPEAGAEDFSLILQQVPGAFIFLGACPPDRDPQQAPTNHAPDALFDDAVLADGATLLATLARRRLESAS
jgi:hippurate hydrolase